MYQITRHGWHNDKIYLSASGRQTKYNESIKYKLKHKGLI